MALLFYVRSKLFSELTQSSTTKKKIVNVKTRKRLIRFKREHRKCRICHDEDGKIPIFNNPAYPNIPEEIFKFSGVRIIESNYQSKLMCQTCLGLLNSCIRFRMLCWRYDQSISKNTIKKELYSNYVCKKTEVSSDDEIINDLPVPASPMDSEEGPDIMWFCPKCSKQLHNESTYLKHISKCKTGENQSKKSAMDRRKKNFLCEICGQTSVNNANLLVHQLIHQNTFPYKCDVCPYRGRRKGHLLVHKRAHLPEKPYKCTDCPKAFFHPTNLGRHMQRIHKASERFKCAYCDRTFNDKSYIKQHMSNIHFKQGINECKICKKQFRSKMALQDHRRKTHSETFGKQPAYLQFRVEENEDTNINT